MPFEVPTTICAATVMNVGVPKFLFPASENACPFSFLSRVQRTTSQGGLGVSVSDWSSTKLELNEAWRLWEERKAGEEGRLPRPWIEPDEEIRDLKRRSKGRKE